MLLRLEMFRSRPEAPGTEAGSKFDANTKPSCTLPVASAASKVIERQEPVLLGREAVEVVAHADVEREVRRQLPVVGDEPAPVGHADSCERSSRLLSPVSAICRARLRSAGLA